MLTQEQALGLYIPPGFINIRYGLFIVFGCLCMLAAVQFYFTYPETAGKTLVRLSIPLFTSTKSATDDPRRRKSRFSSLPAAPSRGRPGRATLVLMLWLTRRVRRGIR